MPENENIPIASSDSLIERGRRLSKKSLINRLNFLNFQNGTIQTTFKHKLYDKRITIAAIPQPCDGQHLDCLWVTPPGPRKLNLYILENLLIQDGEKLFEIRPEVYEVSEKGLFLALPEYYQEVRSRQVSRYLCEAAEIQLIQNSTIFFGKLIEFSILSFRVEISAIPPQTFHWLNQDIPVFIIIQKDGEVILSSECKIIRQGHGHTQRIIVLEPLNKGFSRFSPKKYRSSRTELLPPPTLYFNHPLIGNLVSRPISDISGTGLAIEEDVRNSILLPGMVIPEVQIRLGQSLLVKCKAQVVHKTKVNEDIYKCGIAFLDMKIDDHMQIQSLTHQANDKNSHVNNVIDIETLMKFFFETGFIYPEKYSHLASQKHQFITVYEKLYNHSPHLARHFIYQERGTILGHMAMLRYYSSAWLIHHHAAQKSESNRAGLVVLTQIGRSIKESHRLYSSRMNFVFAYFRPENKFPRRVFGGVSDFYKDSKRCSVDSFAYLHSPTSTSAEHLELPWRLSSACREDLSELEFFYEKESNGLLIQCQDLGPNLASCDEISKEFQRVGLQRERLLFSLRKEEITQAIFVVNISDFGLNMSELTNCVQAFVLDQNLPRHIFDAALKLVMAKCPKSSAPILGFPLAYFDESQIPYEKTYNLWILSCCNVDPYFEFCERLLRKV